MTFFVAVNWFFCLTTSLFLGTVLWRYRFLLVKPSIVVITFFHLIIQWPAAVQAKEIETFLPNPWVFALLAHGFPLIGLVGSLFAGTKSALIIWRRIRQPGAVAPGARRNIIWVLSTGVVLVSAVYLVYLPLSSTGLYSIITDPQNAAQARENSLKLIGSEFIKYLYSFMANVCAPLLVVLLAMSLWQRLKRKQWVRSVILAIAIAGVLFAVSLTGARSYAASMVLTVLFAWFLKNGFRINLSYVVLGAVAALAFPTILTILREGRELNLANFWLYLTTGILGRVFVIPVRMGLWHVHYAQTVGFIGVAGIPRLASLFGVEPINVANMIALYYVPQAPESTLANSCYVFSYYAYFGLVSLVFSLLGLWLLDLALWVYRRLSDALLLSCVAAVSVACTGFLSVDYTIVLLTGGLGGILILALILDKWGRRRRSGRMAKLFYRDVRLGAETS